MVLICSIQVYLDPRWKPEEPHKKGLFARFSVCLSGLFHGTESLGLLNFGTLLETHLKLCMTEPYSRTLVYYKILHYFLYSCANPIE